MPSSSTAAAAATRRRGAPSSSASPATSTRSASQAFHLPEHDAEDVFQEVFARVYEHLPELRRDDAVRPWIGQLTRRLCIDKLRSSSREQPEGDEEALAGTAADDTLAELETAFDVHEALAELPGHCREILDRFFAKDESYRSIGEALELPAGTIASRISRCLGKLRDTYQVGD